MNNKCNLHNEFQINIKHNGETIDSYKAYNRVMPEAFQRLKEFRDIFEGIAVYGATISSIDDDTSEDSYLISKNIESIEEKWTEEWKLTRKGTIRIEPHELNGKKIRQVGLYADGNAMTMARLKNSEGRQITINKDGAMSIEIVAIVYYTFNFNDIVNNFISPSEHHASGVKTDFMQFFLGHSIQKCTFNSHKAEVNNYKNATKRIEGNKGILEVDRLETGDMNGTMLTRAQFGSILLDLRKSGQTISNAIAGKGNGTNDTFIIPHRNPSLTEEITPKLTVFVNGVKQEENRYEVIKQVDYLRPSVIEMARGSFENISFFTAQYYVTKNGKRVYFQSKDNLSVNKHYPFSIEVPNEWAFVYITEDLTTMVFNSERILKHFKLEDGIYVYHSELDVLIGMGTYHKVYCPHEVFTVKETREGTHIIVEKCSFDKMSKRFKKPETFQIINTEDLSTGNYAIDIEEFKMYFINDDGYLYEADLTTLGVITPIKRHAVARHGKFVSSGSQEICPYFRIYTNSDTEGGVSSVTGTREISISTATKVFGGDINVAGKNAIILSNYRDECGAAIYIDGDSVEVVEGVYQPLYYEKTIGDIKHSATSNGDFVSFLDLYRAKIRFKPGFIPGDNASVTANYALLGIEKKEDQIVDIGFEFEYLDGGK